MVANNALLSQTALGDPAVCVITVLSGMVCLDAHLRNEPKCITTMSEFLDFALEKSTDLKNIFTESTGSHIGFLILLHWHLPSRLYQD